MLVALPFVFAFFTAFTFCTSSVTGGILLYKCGPSDLAGRYGTPFMLSLPFLLSGGLTLLVMFLVQSGIFHFYSKQKSSQSMGPQSNRHPHFFDFPKVGLLGILLLYFCVQGYAYTQANTNYTFQTSGCVIAPANNDPIIAYMYREHIRYAWAANWVGNPIAFKTNNAIIIVDPRMTGYPGFINRIPSYTTAVSHADRASILALAHHNDAYPSLLKTLDEEHILYRTTRFSSQPGFDVLVITPLNRSVSPSDADYLGVRFGHC